MTAVVPLVLAFALLQSEDPQRHRNVGKAYYEQGEYTLAIEELGAVLESDMAGARDYFNVAMAYLQNGEQDRARAAFETAKQMDPDMIEVDFGLGVLYKRQLRFPLALEAFERVAARDPDDPCTVYNVGGVSFSMQRIEDAERAFEKVRAMGHARAQNFYVSALFRSANILARRGEREEAEKLFEAFQTLRDQTPSVSLTPTALENGKYGRVEIPIDRVETVDVGHQKVELAMRGEIRFADAPCEREPSLALGDYDNDGKLDVFVASPCGRDVLLRAEGGGQFEDVTDRVGLASSRQSSGAVFVDDDNSGSPSLYVWSRDEAHLYRNRDGRFEDVAAEAGIGAGADVALFLDADNDGRLDLFAASAESGLSLYRSEGDGRFAATWRDETTRARGAVAADFDGNGFTDILVGTDSGDGLLLDNDGSVGDDGLSGTLVPLGVGGSSSARLFAADFNHDGWPDVVAFDDAGAATLVNQRGRLESFSALRGWASLVPADLDGDGYTSFLGRDVRGRLALVSYQGAGRFGTRSIRLGAEASGFSTAADVEGDGGALVLMAGRDGRMRLFERTKPAAPSWLRIALEGTKTNRQALGAVVEVKAGSFYQSHVYQGRPLTLYTGARDRLDVVRITWNNGVIQNDVNVAMGQTLDIKESEQQASSCPFVYIWDGKGFRFLSDVVGRAPLGEVLPDGNVVTPNPEDYVRIPPGAMAARDGRFSFQFTEELRELAAIDALELLVFDHADDVELYTNERFSAPPFEPFRVYGVGERWSPSEAFDAGGNDILPQLGHADGHYVTTFARDRIAGFAQDHALVLTVPEDAPSESLWLFLTGWVYWPSSSSMKALQSHGSMAARPPALQVMDPAGNWVTVIEDLGLPSGIGRTLAAELTGKFLSEDRRVRVVSNFAVYWDRAFFARLNATPDKRAHVLEPKDSHLHYRGFSSVRLDQRESPERYDYDDLQTGSPWNAAAGHYTRYGDVNRLLEETDGALVVMAPGDEMSVSFDAQRLPSLPSGWERSFFLHVTGWAKDQDPNTLFSKTVAPLPGDEPAWAGSYQTREVPALVTPLAPPEAVREK